MWLIRFIGFGVIYVNKRNNKNSNQHALLTLFKNNKFTAIKPIIVEPESMACSVWKGLQHG